MGARETHINYFLARLEAKSADVYKAFLQAAQRLQNGAVLTTLADAIANMDIDRIIRLLGLDAGAFTALDEALRETYIAGAAGAAVGLRPNGAGAKLLVLFNVRNPSAEAWLRDSGAERVTGILNQMRGVLSDSLRAGMEAGKNPLTVAKELVGVIKKGELHRKGGTILLTRERAATVAWVRAGFASGDSVAMTNYLSLKGRDKRFDRAVRLAIKNGVVPPDLAEKVRVALADNYLKERANTIARTEALSALNNGKAEAFRQATERAGIREIAITREWSSTGDRFVRPDHVHLDGQKVTGLSTPYRLRDGSPIMRPGDMRAGAAQVVHCRCLEYLEVDWFGGRT